MFVKLILKLLVVIFFLFKNFSVIAQEKNEYKLIIEKLNSIERRIKDIEQKIENPFSSLLKKSLKQNDISKKSKTVSKKVLNSQKNLKIEENLIVKGWDASEYKSSVSFTKNIKLTYTLQNVSDKTILLIDGDLVFYDALEEKLGTFVLRKDFKMLPGETRTYNGIFELGVLTDEKIFRIISMDKKLIVPYLKVKQILFNNNETIKF